MLRGRWNLDIATLACCLACGRGFARFLGHVPGVVAAGAVLRVRPKMMTVVAIMAGLLPIMWGTGSEVMRRIAVPMVGGMISATVLTLLVIPAAYALIKEVGTRRALGATRHAF